MYPNPDKKFNVVLYRMDECPPDMSKSARFQADMNNVVKVFSTLCNVNQLKIASG